MKVKNVSLKDFRSAEEISIDFMDNLNVLVGVNGAGKTTILEALAVSLSWLVNRIERAGTDGMHIADADIRFDAPFSSIKIGCTASKKSYSWELIRAARGENVAQKSALDEVANLATFFQDQIKQVKKLPVIAFYPVSRAVDQTKPEYSETSSLHILGVYEHALGGKQNYQSFFEWFRLQDDILNERDMSRGMWMLENEKWIRRQLDDIFSLIQDTYKDIPTKSTCDIRSETKKYIRFDVLPDKSHLLFIGLSFLTNSIIEKFDLKNRSIFYFLKNMLQEMSFLSEYKNHYQVSDGHFYRKIKYIFRLLTNHKNKQEGAVTWKIMYLGIQLSLWWFSTEGRQELSKLFSEEAYLSIDKNTSNQLLISLRKLIDRELEKPNNSQKNEGQELIIVKKAIEQFLPDYSFLRVKRTPRPHMLINKGNQEFNLNQLSAGEKNLITLVGDIARRLAIANPQSSDPLQGTGIILIDEIDLHLHPSWQRLVVPQLLKTFPNIQFFLTTHSPQVISHVQPESLFLLKNEGNTLTYSKATESYGKNTDRILEDLLGVAARPPEEKERIHKLYRLIEKGQLEDAKQEIDALSKLIVGGDPELMKAKVLIKRKEIIGK